jgi:hypothetical protein
MSAKFDFTDAETRNWLRDLLKSEVVTLTFTKKDGTQREMVATLSEARIPKTEKSTESAGTRKYSDEAQPVYDIEAEGWRSFRWDSLSKLEFSIGDENVG